MAVDFFNLVAEAFKLIKDISRIRIQVMTMIIHVMENCQTPNLPNPHESTERGIYSPSSILNQILLNSITIIMKVGKKTIIVNKVNVDQVDRNLVMDQ